MRQIDLIAINLGAKLTGNPFASIDLNTGQASVRRSVSNIDNLVGVMVSLRFPCARVLVLEVCVLSQPPEYRGLGGHICICANRAQAFAICETFADNVTDLVSKLASTPHKASY